MGLPIGASVNFAPAYRDAPCKSTNKSTNILQKQSRATKCSGMRPSASQIERVAAALVRRLVDQKLLELDAPEAKVQARFVALLNKNFDEEEAIEREAMAEAEKLIRQGAPGVRREELDLRRVEQLVKQRIAKAKGFAL